MINKNFIWHNHGILITYDLSNNDISASQIANASNGNLFTCITFNSNNQKYQLPNTTLWFSGSKEQARDTFLKAFNTAKSYYSSCSINKILIIDVGSKSSYIEN